MSRPMNIPDYQELGLKLRIKSSIPKVKATLALLILIYESEGRKDKVVYSKEVGTTTVLDDVVEDNLKKLLNPIYTVYGETDANFIDIANENAMLNAQIEHLEVAFELIYKLGQISFVDKTKTMQIERTGGTRYAKKIDFSAYMDLISLFFDGSDSVKYKETLLNWLGITSVPEDVVASESLCKILTVMSENAVFNLKDGTEDIFFNQNEMYKAILANPGMPIDIDGDKEPMGALRIIKRALGDKINPSLNYSGGAVTSSVSISDMAMYQSRVDTLLKVFSVEKPKKSSGTLNKHTKILDGLERNLIYFGAPGTGKSYQLNKKVHEIISSESQMERVTFYPDYSYSQFVGTYKPVSEETGEISYKFVPGPFTRVLVEALKSGKELGNNAKPYFLVVEEINRAKVAAVFGDVFQLLDRTTNNYSEYTIQASEDLKKYLAEKLGGDIDEYAEIFIPDNMFIWATMNSADQGVFPMDTAFKRRWNFKYIGIDDEEITEDKAGKQVENVKLRFMLKTDEIRWNVLRRALNKRLSDTDINAHEDKLMGPFFLKCDMYKLGVGDVIDSSQNDKFIDVFCEKVLMYLFEDVARNRRPELFANIVDKCNRYSDVVRAFKENGMEIFGKEFIVKYYKTQETEYDDKKTSLGV